jgi:hypothetical protein
MIIKVMGSHILSCDICGMDVTKPFSSLDQVLDYIKQNRWKMTVGPKGYDFKHVCPDCQGEYCHD